MLGAWSVIALTPQSIAAALTLMTILTKSHTSIWQLLLGIFPAVSKHSQNNTVSCGRPCDGCAGGRGR